MVRPDDQFDRLDDLLQLWCDERLNEAEAAELGQLLATSETARQGYVEMVQLNVALADWSQPVASTSIPKKLAGATQALNGNSAAVQRALEAGATAANHSALSQAAVHAPQPIEQVGRSWRPLLAAAAMLLLSVSLGSWLYFRDAGGAGSPRDSLAGPAAPAAEKQALVGTFVARVVELTSDAEWGEDLQPREFLMRLRAGEPLHLVSGLAHLEFYSGAHVILHGPSKFIPTGPASGKLETGRLTGKVEGGNFLLVTPTARVVDLGTEFGVTVGPLFNTDVSVFEGEVQVQPGLASVEHENRGPPAEAYQLTPGMSVRVAATGRVSEGQQSGVESELFARSLPLPFGDSGELDLVDIICGGNGRGQRLAAAIDPLTGHWDQRDWVHPYGPGNQRSDGQYHETSWHPFIDGVFIPQARLEPLQIDSLGRIVQLPKGRGNFTWGPVWARRATKDLAKVGSAADVWGADTHSVITGRLAQARHGGIGIHASVGITFDLRAIGRQHLSLIERFQAVLTNLDNSQEHNPEWANENTPTADFYVFIDGELRYEKLNFARNVEGLPFEVDLSPQDQFLTLVTTHGGDGNRYDHVVVIDPVLIVGETDRQNLSVLWQRSDDRAR